MKNALGYVIGVGFFLLVAIGFMSFVTANNYGADMESKIETAWKDSESVLAQYTLQIAEAAQVPDMMKDDLKEVLRETFEGRYGPNGSKATFQWIQEQNPNVSADMYVKLQQMIESGRNKYTNKMSKGLDVKRQYVAATNYFWRGFWLKQAGYPKIDLDAFKIISTSKIQQEFETGLGTPLQLN